MSETICPIAAPSVRALASSMAGTLAVDLAAAEATGQEASCEALARQRRLTYLRTTFAAMLRATLSLSKGRCHAAFAVHGACGALALRARTRRRHDDTTKTFVSHYDGRCPLSSPRFAR